MSRAVERLRILLWTVVALLVLAVAAPFVLKDRHGHTLLTPADVHLPKVAVPDLPHLPGLPRRKGEDATLTVYRWQDPEGVWHYSDRPPEPGSPVEAEVLEVGTPTVAPEPPPGPEPDAPAAPEPGTASGLLPRLSGVVQGARDAGDVASEPGGRPTDRLDAAEGP